MAKKKSKKIQKRRQQKQKKQKTKKKRKSGKKYVGTHDTRVRNSLLNVDNPESAQSFFQPPFSELKNFDATNFRIVYQPLAPDEYEKVLIRKLKQLDYKFLGDEKRSSAEQLNYSDLAGLGARLNLVFHQWCMEKGITIDLADVFSFCARIFFEEMYGAYQRPLPLLNSGVLDMFLSEFLSGEIFEGRKFISYIPKSLHLFYRFLQEKGYGVYNIAEIIYTIERFDRKIIRSYIPSQDAE